MTIWCELIKVDYWCRSSFFSFDFLRMLLIFAGIFLFIASTSFEKSRLLSEKFSKIAILVDVDE